MARTFEQRIEALTKIDITSSSVPTQDEITQLLDESIKDLTNKLTKLRPKEAFKFASESSDSNGSGIEIRGQVLSVVRENGSSSDVRPASEISAQLRYLATDVDSLHYRSKYNPAFYIYNRKIYVLPAPSDTNNQAIVSHINYATSFYNQCDIPNFPNEYEDLVLTHSAAKCCQIAAADIQNNMPDKPTKPTSPNFEDSIVDLPSPPTYSPPELNINFGTITKAIANEDFDTAEKNSELLSKKLEIYGKKHEQQEKFFQRDADLFKADLDRVTKNADRDTQINLAEYRSEIYKYQYDITEFSAALQEKYSRYKWYMEQYIALMNEYNAGLQMAIGQRQSSKSEAPKMPPKEQQQAQEQQGGI